MFRILSFGVVLTLAGAPAESPRGESARCEVCCSEAPAANPKVLRALDGWLKQWRRGKLAMAGPDADRNLGMQAISVKLKVLPKGVLGRLTAKRELEILVDEVVKLQSAEAAQGVLEVASAGLDQMRYTPSMAARSVREIGEKGLAQLESDEARAYIFAVARGDVRASNDKDRLDAMRAAALRGLGALKIDGARATLEQELGVANQRMRLAGVEGLARLQAAESAEALAKLVGRETDQEVLDSAVSALQATLTTHGDAIATPVMQLAVANAIGALGRGSWRSDMAIVAFLERFRSAESIVSLIDILQRFLDHPDQIRSGELSGLLRYRAHETLIALTGALYPMDRPDQWREFWEREKGNFKLVKAEKTENDKGKKSGTVSTGFFGVPVRGSRVLFIVDLSGSMNSNMAFDSGTEIPDRIPTRLDRAKAELIRAVTEMPEVSSFNLITFNGRPNAKPWNKGLVPATDANKKRFYKFVEGLDAEGGTNTWAGLELGLEVKTFVYEKRYEVNVDEIFVISDGMPSVGEVVDAQEILRLVAETNRFAKIRINTIFIADQLNERDRMAMEQSGMRGDKFMKLLAEQNGGDAVNL